MTMAISLIDQCHLLFSFVLVFIMCDRRLYLQLAVASQKVTLTSGPHLYHKCEELIRKEVAKIDSKELAKEEKLTRVFDKSDEGGSTFFMKDDKSLGDPLFSWKSINLTGIEDIIIIGASNSGESSLEQYMPYGWMAGTFMTMRKVNASITKREPSAKIDYYALVAYVRKDSKGSEDLKLEWDRWSRNIVSELLYRANALEAAKDFSLKTFLCAYGSCSCAACDCKKKTNAKSMGKVISSGNKAVPKINASKGVSPKSEASKKPSGTKSTTETSQKTKEKVESARTANATAYSKKGKAHAASLSDGKSSAYSEAKSTRKNAISESSASMGQSTTYASGFSEALSDSSSRTGDSQAVSKTSDGFAQAASQSYGGGITAAAMKEGDSETDYNDDSNSTDDKEEKFDPDSLVKDTNKAFSEANQRFHGHKRVNKRSIEDKCSMESATEDNLTRVEWELLLRKENASKVDAKTKSEELVKDPIFLYQSPLRYGIDVDVGVNTSVLITSAIPGYTAPQASCCNLTVSPSSTVGKFLSKFRQDCNPDFQSQVGRLEKSFSDSNLLKLMKIKKLDPNQTMDLVPMVLLKMFINQNLRKAIPIINALYNNGTSDDINLITILVIHATHYTTKDGHLHKVKILKGLTLNVKTVLTGILLETKKCQEETKLCSKMVILTLENERRLLIGLYMFLKFAESRFTYFSLKDPVTYFADFMKLHKTSIDLLAECKSKRITDIVAALK